MMNKKIIYSILSALLFAVIIGSCKKETGPILENLKAPTFTGPQSGGSYVLTNADADNVFETFSWTEAEYNVPIVVTYTLEVDVKSDNFANPVDLASTEDDSLDVKVFDINLALTTKLGLTPGQEYDVSFRVASHGGDSERTYSDVLDLKITPYDPPYTPDSLFIMSGTTKLKSLALLDENGNYEGYVWLNDAEISSLTIKGSDAEAREFGSVSSSFADPVTTFDLDETGNPFAVDSVGYYRFKINMFDKTVEVMGTKWGIIGSAVFPYAWNGDVFLDYISDRDVWEVSTDTIPNPITDGEFKFRPNSTWDPLNYGDDGADGIPDEYGANIAISAGNYKITLDLSEYPYSISITPITK